MENRDRHVEMYKVRDGELAPGPGDPSRSQEAVTLSLNDPTDDGGCLLSIIVPRDHSKPMDAQNSVIYAVRLPRNPFAEEA